MSRVQSKLNDVARRVIKYGDRHKYGTLSDIFGFDVSADDLVALLFAIELEKIEFGVGEFNIILDRDLDSVIEHLDDNKE